MKREHEHDTIVDKFWDWWDYVELSELIVDSLAVMLILFLIVGICTMISDAVSTFRAADDLPPAKPADGVAWIMPESGEAAVWLSGVCADEAETARLLEEYTDGDAPVPEWFRPDEEMAVEWFSYVPESIGAEPHTPAGIDSGGIDWNICTTVWGWDGHGAEVWELDLYARIVYLEFWGTSRECCEAGADSILRLWDSGYFGDTLGGVLSARAENGALVYTTYGFVWDAEYDPDGLAEIRSLCEDRFYNGPEWGAEFFQLYGFPEWAVPCYEIDGVYFSTGKGW